MTDFEEGELKIRFDGKTMTWYGRSIFPDPSLNLDPYFANILPLVGKDGIVIRLSQLKFLCSATLHSIIKLIKKLDAAGVKTTLVYSKDLDWQRVAFNAFHTISRIMQNISIEAE